MSIFTQSKNSFENQLPNEKTILLTRKHWFALFAPLFIISVLALLPFIIYFFINSFFWYKNITSLYWFLTSVYFLILWNLLFYNIMLYVLNTVAITNKRVIENQQKGFFKHRVDELKLDRIQDISVKVYGIIPEFLKFGDVEIQTAGGEDKFCFHQLPNPKEIKNAGRRISKSTGL